MVFVLVENGFEETELIVPVDILRRGGVQVNLVGVSTMNPKSTRGVQISCDVSFDDADFEGMKLLLIPGGQPGVDNLMANDKVLNLVKTAAGKMPIGAICAAPMIPGKLGLLKGRSATCYPGCEQGLCGARIEDKDVCIDGGYITARAAGAAFEFGFTLLATLRGGEVAHKVARDICYRRKNNG